MSENQFYVNTRLISDRQTTRSFYLKETLNFYAMLQKRAQENNPIKFGVIGAGKFSSMFLSQTRLTPGMQLTGIAE